MAPLRVATALVFGVLTTWAVAQEQAILSSGSGSLPACAQTCANLVRASMACSGTTSASQTAWICFCQSAYLNTLRQSGVGVCDDTCTAQADLTQVSSWYNTNCGSDNGASEHAGADAAVSTTVAGTPASTSGASAAAGPTTAGLSTTSSTPDTSSAPSGDWWSTHYKWIVMLIVLAIAIPAIALLGRWLKRRHDRRQDQVRNGFNTGITSHSGPISRPDQNHSGMLDSPGVDGSGRASPARTRDAFMPYGYGYSRSESRLGTGQAGRDERRGSPLATGEDASDLQEKGAAVSGPEPAKKKSRRVLVRERSTTDSAEGEKRSRFD